MPKKEELIRKIQVQGRFLDDLLLEISAFREPEPPTPVAPRQESQQDRLMRAREVQEFLRIKPATFYDWLKKGAIPPGENFGGCTRSKRWRLSVISASLAGRRATE